MLEVGMRVRVHVVDTKHWCEGALKALEGKEGVIESGPMSKVMQSTNWLVYFDSPIEPWWDAQSPVKRFHFSAKELIEI